MKELLLSTREQFLSNFKKEVTIKNLIVIILMLLISSVVCSQTNNVEVITEESEFSFVIKIHKEIEDVERNVEAINSAFNLKRYYEKLKQQQSNTQHRGVGYPMSTSYYQFKKEEGGTNENINW